MERYGKDAGTSGRIYCRYDAGTDTLETFTSEEPPENCLSADWGQAGYTGDTIGAAEASAAYFCREWEKHHAPYTGCVLAIDCGASGLRAGLCEVQETGRIHLLAEPLSEQDCGGIAFYTRLAERLCGNAEPALCRSLEQQIQAQAEALQELLQDYLISPEDFPDEEQTAFSLHTGSGDIPVLCSDILGAFQETAEPALRRIIGKIKAMPGYTTDPGSIRILITGGFGAFCCTQDCIRELFGTRTGARDDRFPALGCYDMAVRGAALIAAGAVCITGGYPQEIGLLAAEWTADGVRECEVPLLPEGAGRGAYAEPVYTEMPVRVLGDSPQVLAVYTRRAGERRTVSAEIPPVSGTGDRLVWLGIALRNGTKPVLYAKAENGRAQMLCELPV